MEHVITIREPVTSWRGKSEQACCSCGWWGDYYASGSVDLRLEAFEHLMQNSTKVPLPESSPGAKL